MASKRNVSGNSSKSTLAQAVPPPQPEKFYFTSGNGLGHLKKAVAAATKAYDEIDAVFMKLDAPDMHAQSAEAFAIDLLGAALRSLENATDDLNSALMRFSKPK